MTEFRTKVDQEWEDEEPDESGSATEPQESSPQPEVSRPVEGQLSEAGEALAYLREILDRVTNEARATTEGVADLVAENDNLVNGQLKELGESAEVLPVQMELEEARSELLGVTHDAFDDLQAKIAEATQAESQPQSEPDEFERVAQAATEHIAKNNPVKGKPRPGVLDLDKFMEKEADAFEAATIPVEAEPSFLIIPDMAQVEPERLEIKLDEPDTNVVVESQGEGQLKMEIPLRSQANVSAFNRLSTEAKRVFVDIYEKVTLKVRGRSEINRGQKLLDKSEDKIYNLNKDLIKADDKVDELKDKLANIDEMMAKMGEHMKPKESQAIEKSRQSLENKITEQELLKESLAHKLADEEENKAQLKTGLAKAMDKLDQVIDSRLEPYKKEIAELENNRSSLVEEKETFEAIVDDFENRLAGLKSEMANLGAMDMPVQAKKSFQAVINRKVKDIESALKVSQNNVSKLEDNIIRVNGRLNKEDVRIGKWEETRSDLKKLAEKKPAKERTRLSHGYARQERPELIEEGETPEFSPEDYINKWNSISKNDGLILNKESILSVKGEMTPKRLEGIIKTTRFRGLSEWQLKKKVKEKTDLLRVHFGLH